MCLVVFDFAFVDEVPGFSGCCILVLLIVILGDFLGLIVLLAFDLVCFGYFVT